MFESLKVKIFAFRCKKYETVLNWNGTSVKPTRNRGGLKCLGKMMRIPCGRQKSSSMKEITEGQYWMLVYQTENRFVVRTCVYLIKDKPISTFLN